MRIETKLSSHHIDDIIQLEKKKKFYKDDYFISQDYTLYKYNTRTLPVLPSTYYFTHRIPFC